MFFSDYKLLRSDNAASSPSKIALQILILQCFYYLTALVVFYLVSSLNGYDFNVDWVFSWELIEADNAMGLTLFALWLFDSLLCVFFVTLIVGRSKLAWDFAVTVHILNLVVVWLYTGKFPTSILWWCLQVLSGACLVTLSTYLTRWRELKDTFFDNMLDQQELGQVRHTESIPMTPMANQPSS
ncbi:hypothetical protein EJF18_20963 [Clavispora lusitaniae]|uniref:Protein SYS1 n=3 Tax=Clavispora lusitaniae TaxID=36911 RepID=C4Y9G2_CLAL4|nr:uncharacterized protein CLUG_04852 [Clavispora lusitaniae ATCC 42720]KAF5209369.1 hypothetical protein E0198_004648 [Clavispora lusitaniae]EEQ40724.1 hypothetical protein CLUG_04852 [Clavispora lusitaniae ATCC 42720]OVF10212.1 hypothetical protein A9F13_03g03685 [Clavispora lusitaniae]QFZ27039.1 hypothetical protein EJF14_20963 [Clavispora lusitaniae]QFZ32707.1 hypothetical protein EJF16_20963 [Clavispora lusitaniae]